MEQPAGTTRHHTLGGREAAEARLRALTEIGRAVTSRPAAGGRYHVIDAARVAMAAASASLGVWRPERQLLQTVLNVGDLADWEEAEPSDEVYTADQGTWLTAAPDGSLGLAGSRGSSATPGSEKEYLASLGKQSFVTVPVLLGGQWWGELFFTRRADQPDYSDADLGWATAVAAQVGAALEALEHLAHIERLARTDALTGLANRRAVDEWLDDAVAERRARGTEVSLVVADVNGLKQLNDDQGHDAGDRALVAFARLVEDAASDLPTSMTARMGGDEFCIAAMGADPDHMVGVAEELARRAWRALGRGVSIGVVNTADPIGPVDVGARLLRLADAAQYRAKRLRSRHPVVAGRVLPDDAVGLVPDLPERHPSDRRLLRSHEPRDDLHLLEAGLRALDQSVEEPVRVRLGLVADLVAHHADAVGWWLSLSDPGQSVVTTVEFAVYRAIRGLAAEELADEVGSTFALADYPATTAVLDGGTYVASADDPQTDSAERAILDGLGASGLVAAGGSDLQGTRWLVEVFADGNSRSVHMLASVLRLLVLAALHPAGPAH